MENDVLRNKIVPWQEKGRWYHCRIISDGSNWTVDDNNSDELFKGMSMTGQRLPTKLTGYKQSIVDFKVVTREDFALNTAVSSAPLATLYCALGRPSIVVPWPPSSVTGSADVYAFIVIN